MTRSVPVKGDGSQKVHEDIGLLSYDADRDQFAFRRSLAEGYVNLPGHGIHCVPANGNVTRPVVA